MGIGVLETSNLWTTEMAKFFDENYAFQETTTNDDLLVKIINGATHCLF